MTELRSENDIYICAMKQFSLVASISQKVRYGISVDVTASWSFWLNGVRDGVTKISD